MTIEAFDRVHLDGTGIDRITERGVIVGETEYELDCLIYATGFEVGTAYTRRAGYDVTGVDPSEGMLEVLRGRAPEELPEPHANHQLVRRMSSMAAANRRQLSSSVPRARRPFAVIS